VNITVLSRGILAASLGLAAAIPAVAARRSDDSQPRSSTVVVIDAGHGGFDRGGIPRQQVAEKTMTLDVALRLRSILEKSGYRVVMTRDRDVFVPLPNRVAIANSYRDAIFVCIHFNSATRSGANGIETYFYSRDSLALASAIHYNLIGNTNTPNRGVRRRGYFVLRKTRIPAVLVECGFLTNPTEARNSQNSNYRQGLAENIARGIRNRSAVAGQAVSGPRMADETIPLQPFIDQTHVRDPDLTRKKHRRASKRKSADTSSRHEIASKKKASHKSPED
jgi:N-acetylmuramoyl-L-alanine amidase